MKVIGVTRLTDVTGLDYVGIPVWGAVRPIPDESSISVQNGKGPTRMHARAGALMEAIEHYCCERPPHNAAENVIGRDTRRLLIKVARSLWRAGCRKVRGSGIPINPIVEQIIGKLIIDPTFRQAFKADRQKALARYVLTSAERHGLMQFDVQAIEVAIRNLQMSRAIPMESMFW